MGKQDVERLGLATGLLASASVGVPMLLLALGDDGPGVLWWVAYLAHLLAFLISDTAPGRRPAWLTDRVVLVVQFVAGAVAFALAPAQGFTAVLLVITAVSAAFVLSVRGTVVLIAAQTLLIAVATATVTDMLEIVGFTTLVYTAFQGFAVALVWSRQREASARLELEAVNVELRAANALLDASSRSAERLRIARDLHDLVGHHLTALSLELEVAKHDVRPPAAQHVTRARSIAKELLTSVRETVGNLRLQRLEVREALEAAVAGLSRPHVHLEVDVPVALDDDTALALVRCVQEIVTNTVRHADASNLQVAVTRFHDGRVHLEAFDDGRGVADLRAGNGLTGMRERIEELGGTIAFTTGDRRGFRVRAEVPSP